MSSNRQTLCITPGDPMGIGPEITVKFLNRYLSHYTHQQFKIVGSIETLEKAAQGLGMELPSASDKVVYEAIQGNSPGKIAYLAVERSVEAIALGQACALVTGPISKANLKEAGILANGHTELLEILARRFYPRLKSKAEMLFLYRNFRMLLLTRHIPLSRVSSELTSSNIRLPLALLGNFLIEWANIARPRVALLGVNPHAGEIGGVEESLALIPMIEELNRESKVVFEGPFAADAFFRDFDLNGLRYDAYVAAYHDQGLIPFKMIAGFKAVNVTIGLPFIRTSVSHGTAFDIAGQGIATEESLVEAVDTAIELAASRARSDSLLGSSIE